MLIGDTVITNGRYLKKNPNWRKNEQLVIYKHRLCFEHGTTIKQKQLVVREDDLNLGTLEYPFDAIITKPHRLPMAQIKALPYFVGEMR